MAKKSAGPTYREIITDIRKKKFAPVYLLMGEEPYYLDKIADALADNVIPEEDRDFNSEIFYGSDADIAVVAGAAQQFPVMAERKLVMLREAQSMFKAKTQLEALAPLVKNPHASTVLVVVFKGENISDTSELMKAASKSDNVVVFKSPKLRDYHLGAPLKEYCASIGVGIDDKAMNLLCEYIGSPLSKLFGEVDKLKVAIGSRDRITAQDVENNIGISKDFNNFELKAAVGERNYPKAMQILNYFRKNPKQNPTVLTGVTLFDLFSKLCIAWFSSDRSDSGLVKQLELKNSFALNEFKTALRNYNASQSVRGVHAIREFDAKTKGIGSLQNEYDLLNELIFNLLTL